MLLEEMKRKIESTFDSSDSNVASDAANLLLEIIYITFNHPPDSLRQSLTEQVRKGIQVLGLEADDFQTPKEKQ